MFANINMYPIICYRLQQQLKYLNWNAFQQNNTKSCLTTVKPRAPGTYSMLSHSVPLLCTLLRISRCTNTLCTICPKTLSINKSIQNSGIRSYSNVRQKVYDYNTANRYPFDEFHGKAESYQTHYAPRCSTYLISRPLL